MTERNKNALTDVLLFIFAFALRAALAVRTDLWFDEIHSIAIAEYPAGEILLPSMLKGFGPLYFLVLKAWMLLGHGDLWLRTPSILADSLTAVLIRRLVARDFSSFSAALSGFLYAISPWNIYCGSQVRMHAFGAPFILAWLLSSSTVLRAAYSMTAAFTLPTTAPFLLALGFSTKASNKNRPSGWDRIALGIALAVCFAYAWSGIGAGVRYEAAQWGLIPGTLKGIFFGPYIESPPSLLSILATATGMALVLVGAIKAGRRGLAITILAFVPLHIFLAASLVFSGFWNRRFILPGTPFILALAVLSLEFLPARAHKAAALVLLIVIGHFALRLEDTSDNFHWKTDRRPFVREVAVRIESEGRRVTLDMPATAPLLMWYGPRIAAWGDSRSASFALPAHRAAIADFLVRRGVRFELPDSSVVPLSAVFSPGKR